MNKRIKELAEQAKIEFTYDPTETPMRAFAECWEDELEKFAELIVGECMRRVRSRQRFATEDDQNVTQAFDLLMYDLESLFGVEE